MALTNYQRGEFKLYNYTGKDKILMTGMTVSTFIKYMIALRIIKSCGAILGDCLSTLVRFYPYLIRD